MSDSVRAVVYKYELRYTGQSNVEMPRHAHVLHAGEQDGKLYVWAKVNPDEPAAERQFIVFGTGFDVSLDPDWWFVRTVQMASGLVWHVFTREAAGVYG